MENNLDNNVRHALKAAPHEGTSEVSTRRVLLHAPNASPPRLLRYSQALHAYTGEKPVVSPLSRHPGW